MKKSILLLLSLFLFFSCATTEIPNNDGVTENSKSDKKISRRELEELFWEFEKKDVPAKANSFFKILDNNKYDYTGLLATTVDRIYTIKEEKDNLLNFPAVLESYRNDHNKPVSYSQILSDCGDPLDVTFRYINPYDFNDYLLEKNGYKLSYTIITYSNVSFICNSDLELQMLKVRDNEIIQSYLNDNRKNHREIQRKHESREVMAYDGFFLREGVEVEGDPCKVRSYRGWDDLTYEVIDFADDKLRVVTVLGQGRKNSIEELIFYIN